MALPDLFRLDGRVALVTGGGRGLGRAMAWALAQAGAHLVLASRKAGPLEAAARELEKAHGTRVLAVPCDVGREEDLARLVEVATGAFPRIHVLVNNAGITWGAPTLEYPQEQWDRVFDVNVRGTWILTRRVASHMKEAGGGSIINVSSVLGSRGTDEDLHPAVPYNSTKAAINALTQNLAVKLAPYRIRVNAIAPGFFRTDMMAWIEKPQFAQARQRMLGMIPMGRPGEMEDIQGLALFLASDASAYVTGQVMAVDGGLLAR